MCAECLYVALGGQKTVKAGTVINKGEPQAKAFEPCLLKSKAPLSFSYRQNIQRKECRRASVKHAASYETLLHTLCLARIKTLQPLLTNASAMGPNIDLDVVPQCTMTTFLPSPERRL